MSVDASRRSPTPAMVVAVLALAFALVGSAIAGTDGLSAKLTKAKVKKIAKRQANKAINAAEPGLDVNSARTADRAGTADAAINAANATNLDPPEAYREIGTPGNPPFENGASNASSEYSSAGFYLDRQCEVHLRGFITTNAAKMFTLPPGYRPARNVLAPIAVVSAAGGNVQVFTDGSVLPFAPAGGTFTVGLDGVTFRVAGC